MSKMKKRKYTKCNAIYVENFTGWVDKGTRLHCLKSTKILQGYCPNEKANEYFAFSTLTSGGEKEYVLVDEKTGLIYPDPGSDNLLPQVVEPFGGDDE